MKRIVAFVLLLCVFVTPVYANEEIANEIMPIHEVVSSSDYLFIINSAGIAYVAEEDGTYLFYTGLDIGVDTYGELYNGFKPINSSAVLLASNDDAFNSEDDQSNFNFGIEYDLLAGDIVYIKIIGYENFYWEMNYDFQIKKVG